MKNVQMRLPICVLCLQGAEFASRRVLARNVLYEAIDCSGVAKKTVRHIHAGKRR